MPMLFPRQLPAFAADYMLTVPEMHIASEVGRLRQIASLQQGRTNRYNEDGDKGGLGWGKHVLGAGGELVVARHTGLYWEPTVNNFGEGPDVGGLSVRTRTSLNYDLIVRKKADDNAVYVLVICEDLPLMYVVGWMLAGDAKQAQWLQTHGGKSEQYFVPSSYLNPPDRDTLIQLSHERRPPPTHTPRLSSNGNVRIVG